MEKDRDASAALAWVVTLLRTHNIQYKITGGLAARAYGVERPLADIDIEIEKDGISKIFEHITPHMFHQPHHYLDDEWDLYLVTLLYKGIEIDLNEVGAQIFNKKTQKWQECPGSFKTIEEKEVFDITVPVESKKTLIKYKKIIDRPVDREDIRQLEDSI